MSGCTNCKAKPGCDDRKGDMLAEVDATLARVYPGRRWGEPDDAARAGAGVAEADGVALAEELARELDAAAFWVPGGPEELCDYIWILCVGRTPCLLQVRDLDVPADDELAAGRVEELYLRVCLSSVAPLAAVQQVALDGEPGAGGLVIRERPRAGVYDAPLLRRMQRLVALLPAYDLVHVDFGEIAGPPPGFDAGAWPERYGGEAPAIANYLFFPQPATMVSSTFLALDGGACSTTR